VRLTPESFVACGDSFTEGMDDPYPDGTSFRGWADRVAERLAQDTPSFRYANLAIRGRLAGPVVAEQVPAAAAMRPELASLVAGTNDMLRPGFDVDTVATRIHDGARTLVAAGATVLLVAGGDPRGRGVFGPALFPKVVAFNDHLRWIARDVGGVLVELWAARAWPDPRVWSPDRLHLNSEGHRRVALAVLEALGHPIDDDWRAPVPAGDPTPWLTARRADLVWTGRHLAPWVGRRLRGRSSGDTVTAKRPELTPLA
jgi:lysophospholipase L1-like esterase